MSGDDRGRAKAAPRAVRTTDVSRPRVAALAALGAAAGGVVVMAAARTPLGAERPLTRPHVVAKVACAKCHEPPRPGARAGAGAGAGGITSADRAVAPAPIDPVVYASSGACKACHGASKHASARAGHRALAAKGELRCATCHPAHAGGQGVTFGEGGSFLRWGAGPGSEAPSPPGLRAGPVKPKTTVPFVALAACARCHDPSRASDPIAECVSPAVRARLAADAAPAGVDLARAPSLCFDEHRTTAEATATDRFVAWDAARDVASSTAWVAPSPRSDPPWLPLGGALAGASALGLVATALERRKRSPPRAHGARGAQPPIPSATRRLPVIDTSTCLGCYACVDACPFDVLAIEKYVAVVARPEECCGVVLCEQVCPNGSLGIDEGEAVLDLPAVDEHLESKDVPGLFLAGDLTGLPLIKNAINQGVRAVDRVAATLPRALRGRAAGAALASASPRAPAGAFDVVVIGAGPAGLSAALRAKEKGLSCVVLEQATVAASVKSFPRDKIVYDPPLDLPVEGALWLKEATKEELLQNWTRIVRARELDVREGRRVTAIARAGEGFTVTAARGDAARPDASAPDDAETFVASRVVVAIGRRGTPRTIDMAVEPGAEHRVAYALADARSFAGKRVVVVGLGDAAMEAAIALARQPETSVTVSYRGSGFRRGKARNVAELQQLVGKGRVKLLLETVPVAVTRSAVTLAGTTPGKGRRTVQADAVLVLVGGLPSWDLLTRAGLVRPSKPER
jgi:thioredoxin reductase